MRRVGWPPLVRRTSGGGEPLTRCPEAFSVAPVRLGANPFGELMLGATNVENGRPRQRQNLTATLLLACGELTGPQVAGAELSTISSPTLFGQCPGDARLQAPLSAALDDMGAIPWASAYRTAQGTRLLHPGCG